MDSPRPRFRACSRRSAASDPAEMGWATAAGDVDAALGADLEANGDRIGARQAAEVFNAAARPLPLDVAGVGFPPDDRAIGLDRHPVREYRLGKTDGDARLAVGL